MYSSHIYKLSPLLLQNAMVSGRGYVMNTLKNLAIYPKYDGINQSQWLNGEAIAHLQLERLKAVIGYAAVHVPYYRNAFAVAGFSLEQLVTLADMQRIPLLTKRNVFEAGSQIVAEDWKGCRFPSSTSGTTGMPVKLWRSLQSIHRENVFVERQLLWAGVKAGERRIWIRGDKIVPANVTKPPFWRYSKSDNSMMMSTYHLSEKNAQAYIDAMEAFDPVSGMVYASSLAFLARYLLSAGLRYRGKSLKCFISSSETVTDEQRKVIQDAFGCRLFDWYGSAERVSAIATCEQGNYHILSDYSFTELLPQANGLHELVGTNFDNLLMPLIRYTLEDSVVLADPRYQCPCGRVGFPVIEQIIGRTEDYLLGLGERQIFMAGGIIDGLDNILESQIRQDFPGEVSILIVPVNGRKVNDRRVIARAQEVLGNSITIKVEQVESIPKNRNGKFRAVIRTI